jgi:hypothetical protein
MARLSAASIENTAPKAEIVPDPISYDYQFLNPYDADTRTGPYDGGVVIVSDDDKLPGMPAIWRVSRKLEGWRWKSYGQWVTPLTHVKIGFDPTYWRKFMGFVE